MDRERQVNLPSSLSEDGRSKSTREDPDGDIPSLEYRIRIMFNRKTPLQMREFLKDFLDTTGLESYRGLFNQAMYLAQHPKAYDNGKEPELDFERAGEYPRFPKEDPARQLKPSKQDQVALELDASPTKEPSQERQWRWFPRFKVPDVRRWHALPAAVKHVIVISSIGAMVQGIDEAVVNGAQGLYLAAFGISIGSSSGVLQEANAGKAGLINAAPYLCCVISCWFTPGLNRFLGRRGTIFVCALFSIFMPFAQAFPRTWQELAVYRLLLGIGIGPKSATIPIYAAETAPANIRGGLVTCWQAFTALGIAIGCALSTILHQWGAILDPSVCDFNNEGNPTLLSLRCSWNWRVILACPLIPPIFLAILVCFCRESPRWTVSKAHNLQRKGQTNRAQHYYARAFADLRVLSRSDLLAARDMFIHFFFLQKEYEERKRDRDDPYQTWFGHKMRQLLGKKARRNRRAIIASAICMIAQQLCGVNVLIYYSNYVLGRVSQQNSGEPNPTVFNQTALLNTMGFGIVNFLLALPAFLLIDIIGRRTLLLYTFPLLVFSHIIMAISSNLQGPARQQMFLAGFYLFGIFYSPGEGPVPFVYASESMPLSIREEGMGLVTSINWLLNWFVAFSAPYLFNHFKMGGTFGFYAGLCALMFVLILFFVPETRLLTLEQLDIVFEDKTSSEFAGHAWECCKYRVRLRKTHPGSIYNQADEETRARKGTVDYNQGIIRADSDNTNEVELEPLVVPRAAHSHESSDVTVADRQWDGRL